jgi:Excalibur calcium-binding domain
LKRLLIVVVVIVVGWTAMHRLRPQPLFDRTLAGPVAAAPVSDLPRQSEDEGKFSCDGRVYCSQMTSCAEAKYFLAHCPGTKMDGDGNGIPCERQFCGNH